MKNLDTDILRQNPAEELSRRLFVDIIHWRRAKFRGRLVDGACIHRTYTYARSLRRFQSSFTLFVLRLFGHPYIFHADFLDRQQFLHNQALGDNRLELVVEDVDSVNLAPRKLLNHALPELRSKSGFHLAENSNVLAYDLHSSGALPIYFRSLVLHRNRKPP